MFVAGMDPVLAQKPDPVLYTWYDGRYSILLNGYLK